MTGALDEHGVSLGDNEGVRGKSYQKCTVLMPTSLSQARLNQLWCCCWAPSAVLCHLLLLSRKRNRWARKAWDACAEKAPCRRAGRDARMIVLATTIL